MTKKRLKKSVRQFSKAKENKIVLIDAELGIPLNGNKIVEVTGRPGFVYARIRGNQSELIQAYNAAVSPIYGLPVLLARDNNIYKVIGRNLDRYRDWGNTPYLPKHGGQHSFNHELGMGADVTWVYSQQFMPLLAYPSGSAGSMYLSLSPAFYEYSGQWKYAQTTGTPDFTPYLPTSSGSAVMALLYVRPSDNSLQIVAGSPFSATTTGSAQVAQYIPSIAEDNAIPVAAVRLTTGTTYISWDAIYDVRPFFHVTQTSAGGGGGAGIMGWDEGLPLGTGTVLNVTGQRAVLSLSGSVLNLNISPDPQELIGIYALDDGSPVGTGTTVNFGNNLSVVITGSTLFVDAAASGGGGGSVGVLVQDEGVPLGTGTTMNFVGNGVTATLSGSVANINIPGGMEFITRITPVGTPTGTFASIPTKFSHLKMIFAFRSTVVATFAQPSLFYNQDYTAGNYRRTLDFGHATSTVGADGASNAQLGGVVDGASSPTGSFSMGEVTIPFYQNTDFNREAFSVGAHRRDLSSVFMLAYNWAQEWGFKNAINRMDVVLDTGNFVTGSVADLYGIY